MKQPLKPSMQLIALLIPCSLRLLNTFGQLLFLLLQSGTSFQGTIALDKFFLKCCDLLVSRVEISFQWSYLFGIVVQVWAHVQVWRFQLINFSSHPPQGISIFSIVRLNLVSQSTNRVENTCKLVKSSLFLVSVSSVFLCFSSKFFSLSSLSLTRARSFLIVVFSVNCCLDNFSPSSIRPLICASFSAMISSTWLFENDFDRVSFAPLSWTDVLCNSSSKFFQ